MVWYYVKDGARQGPVEEDEINQLAAQSVVTPTTLVWHEGMAEWKPYSEMVPATPPPVPAPEPVSEPAPLIEAAPAAPEPEAPAAAAAPIQYCSHCGKPYPAEEMVRFGTGAVCANCMAVAGPRIYAGFWIRFLAIIIDGILISIVRYFGKWLSGFVLMFGYIMAGFDPEKRALHDYLAGTRVIKTER